MLNILLFFLYYSYFADESRQNSRLLSCAKDCHLIMVPFSPSTFLHLIITLIKTIIKKTCFKNFLCQRVYSNDMCHLFGPFLTTFHLVTFYLKKDLLALKCEINKKRKCLLKSGLDLKHVCLLPKSSKIRV